MKIVEIHSQIQKLQGLFKKSEDISKIDFETQSHWAKYLCVLSAGLLENALPLIFSEYSKKRSDKQVSNFVLWQLSKIQNPKAEKYLDVTKSFDESWGNRLKDFLEEEGKGSAIDSIMSNRHNIAHGKKSDITIAQLKEYFNKSIRVLEFLEKQSSI